MKIRTLTIDPEFASLIPPLTKDEREQLERGLLTDGCLDALAIWHDTLIDGHNRYEICQKHGIEFSVTNINLPTRDDVITWIIQHQLGRRNLSDFVRVELALRIKLIVAAKAEAREKAGHPSQNSDEGRTDQKIADAAHVSRDTVRKVEAIKKNGSAVLVAAAKADEISIHKAAKIAKLPKAKQAKAMAAPKPKKEKAPKAEKPNEWQAKYEALVSDYNELKENRDDLADELKTCEAIRKSEAVLEMNKLREHLKICTRRRDELMANAVELRKMCKWWEGQARKLGYKREAK